MEQQDLSGEPGWKHDEREALDSISFQLVMNGIRLSIKLHEQDPSKGMTKAQAEENLKRWFPEADIVEEI